MIVISNSSPLIALSRIGGLNLLKSLFGEVLIPDSVYQETVTESNIEIQRENISKAIGDGFLKVMHPTTRKSFVRNLGQGEKGVLNLAAETNPDILIIDDKKARKEARKLGFHSIFTTDILKEAQDRNLINSYEDVVKKLFDLQIYLPE